MSEWCDLAGICKPCVCGTSAGQAKAWQKVLMIMFGILCLCPSKAETEDKCAASIGDKCICDMDGFVVDRAGKKAEELSEGDEWWPSIEGKEGESEISGDAQDIEGDLNDM